MDKILLMYNSKAGDGNFNDRLHNFVEMFQNEYMIEMFDVTGVELAERFAGINTGNYKFFFIAGGDGTVNRVINQLMNFEIKVPTGILPVGTSNDFACSLKLSDNFEDYRLLMQDENNIKNLDLGLVNDRYFVNVCASGFLTSVAYETPTDLKNLFGKVAYYLKGMQKLTELKPLPVKITTAEKQVTKDLCIVLILNSGRAGGFSPITPARSLNDGEFELVAVEYGRIYEMFTALVDIFLNNDWQHNENIVFLRSNSFLLDLTDSAVTIRSDIDGEEGPLFPLDLQVKSRVYPFLLNSSEVKDID